MVALQDRCVALAQGFDTAANGVVDQGDEHAEDRQPHQRQKQRIQDNRPGRAVGPLEPRQAQDLVQGPPQGVEHTPIDIPRDRLDGRVLLRKKAKDHRRHADERDRYHQHEKQQQLPEKLARKRLIDQVTNLRPKLFDHTGLNTPVNRPGIRRALDSEYAGA